MRVRELFHRNESDEELDDEIQAHLDMAIRDRIERGEDPAAAEAAARREFGNRTQVKETTGDILGWNTLERVLQDLRYGLRGLRRNPGFTFVAIASLALGIGANTAIFSLMNTVMFHMLPVQDPERLVELLQKYPGEPRGNGYWTWKDYEHFRAHNTVFSDIIGTSFDNVLRVQVKNGTPQHAVGEFVTLNYFKDLGVQPAMGRIIGPGDDPASQDVAVVSWSFWRNFLGANPRLIGERIFVANRPVTVVGVAPPRFLGPRVDHATDVWLPHEPSEGTLGLLARLKPGVTIEQARAEMAVLYRFTIQERLARSDDPLVHKLKVEVERAGSGLNGVRDRFGQSLVILMVIVGLLLLITCVNLAGLLLARGAAREREFAVRAGLGASRTRLATQVLTESVLLSISGGLCGILLAYAGTRVVVYLLATGRVGEQVHLRVGPDLHVLLFSATVAIVTGLFFGMAPALHAIGSMPGSALRQTGATENRSKRFLGLSLVVTQIALSVLLLSTGALFIVHLWKLEHEYLGFQREDVFVIWLDPSGGAYSRQRLATSYEDILTRFEAIPGVRSAALAGPTPLSGAGASGFVNVQGFTEKPADRRWIAITYISPNYFRTLGSPILAGRDFRRQDQIHSRVAIINQTFARHYFSHRDPIGQTITLYHVTLDARPKTYEVIGVTADAHYYGIREPQRSGVFLPAFHDGGVSADSFVLRTGSNGESTTRSALAIIHQVLPKIAIFRTITLNAQIDASILPERLIAVLSGAFAALGALLAGLGIYGLLAYTVARRAKEIGIRIALGATTGNVQRKVVREALGVAVAGLALGLPVAIAGRLLASHLLPDVEVNTTVPVLAGAAVIVLGTLIASYVPIRRAACIDPMQALRHD